MKITQFTPKEFYSYLSRNSPQLRSIASDGMLDRLEKSGLTAMKDLDYNSKHQLYNLMASMALKSVISSEINNTLMESFPCTIYESLEYAEIFRDMRVLPTLGVDPGFLKNGHGLTVDDQKQYKAKVVEYAWKRNFNGQYPITIYAEVLMKNIFNGPGGLNALTSAILSQPMNAFLTDMYQLKREALYKGITSEDYPLRDTQKLNTKIDWTIDNDPEVLRKEFRKLLDTIDNITSMQVSTKAFNQAGVPLAVDKEDLVLIMRPGIYNQFKTFLKADSYNKEIFDFPITVLTLPDFAGLTPFKDTEYKIPLYPVYGSWGELIGFNTKKDQTVIEVEEDKVCWKDSLANLQYCLTTRKAIFMIGIENLELNVTPFNAVGLYATHVLSAPNMLIAYDHQESFVGFFNGDVDPNA